MNLQGSTVRKMNKMNGRRDCIAHTHIGTGVTYTFLCRCLNHHADDTLG